MKVRINQLWKVPVFCVLAGIVSWYFYIYLVAWIGVETLPDGSIGANETVTWSVSAAVFAVTLLAGWRIFRKMSRKEIFFSATILVVPLVLFVIVQAVTGGTSPLMIRLSLYYAEITEWGSVVPQLLYLLTNNAWPGAFLSAGLPYVFVLFGRKQIQTAEETTVA